MCLHSSEVTQKPALFNTYCMAVMVSFLLPKCNLHHTSVIILQPLGFYWSALFKIHIIFTGYLWYFLTVKRSL